MLQSILIANRGEVAVRVIRACRELGIRSIAVYSDADEGALHVRLADEAHRLGAASASESYLDIARIIGTAKACGAEAVHPGYGLLSESAEFAEAVREAGLKFIGPSAEVIATMGDKVAARDAATRSGVPLLPGSEGAISDPSEALRVAEQVGYPVVVKACFGGGGRGMRVVSEAHTLKAALEEAARESSAAFGRAEVYLEHYVSHARHVEVQVLGDGLGSVVHLGDRDCSVQRRHQKMIEEAPAPQLSDELRAGLAEAAVRLAHKVGYRSAGTVEFLVDAANEKFYFLEMNTRLQVEHGVTEMISGVDLVQCQIRVASGEPLGFAQDDVRLFGHAIQGRISAEDPWESFRPTPGKASNLRLPLGPWLRLDFGIESGDSIPSYYDSMFGKLQAWGPSRESARTRLSVAIETLQVGGFPTTAPYLRQVLNAPEFIEITHDTGSVERSWPPNPALCPKNVEELIPSKEPASVEAASERVVSLSTLTGCIEINVFGRGGAARATRARAEDRKTVAAKADEPVSPMDGAVVAVKVKAGEVVEQGATLVVLEAMKMEVPVLAPRAGCVEEVLIEVGQVTNRGNLLVRLSAPDA